MIGIQEDEYGGWLGDYVEGSVRDTVVEALWSSAWGSVHTYLCNSWYESVQDHVYAFVRGSVWAPVVDSLGRSVGRSL